MHQKLQSLLSTLSNRLTPDFLSFFLISLWVCADLRWCPVIYSVLREMYYTFSHKIFIVFVFRRCQYWWLKCAPMDRLWRKVFPQRFFTHFTIVLCLVFLYWIVILLPPPNELRNSNEEFKMARFVYIDKRAKDVTRQTMKSVVNKINTVFRLLFGLCDNFF